MAHIGQKPKKPVRMAIQRGFRFALPRFLRKCDRTALEPVHRKRLLLFCGETARYYHGLLAAT